MTLSAEAAEVLDLAEPETAAQRPTRRHRGWLIAAAAALTVLAVAGGTLVALTKTVTITVDGVSRTITTLAGSVSGALADAELTVAEHDTLAPSAGARIADGSTIVVNRGRLLTLTIDGRQVALWTTSQTVEDALAGIGRDPADYQLSADRSRRIPLDGLSVDADTLHSITLDVRGTLRTVPSVAMTVAELLAAERVALSPKDRVTPALTSMMTTDTKVTVITLPTVTVTDGAAAATEIVSDQATVADLIAGAGITLGDRDVLSVPLDTKLTDGLQVVITRISSTQVTETVTVEQPSDETVNDGALAAGTTKVTQVGQAGQQAVVYDLVLTNGVQTSRTEVSRTDTIQALPTITQIGTKVATPAPSAPAPAVSTPAPAATPAPTEAVAPPPASGGTEWVGGRVFFNDTEYGVNWDGLAKCESGNNPRAINPSGKYTGLFQFDDRTWQSVGGSGRSYDAPAEEQLMRAKLLYLARGLQPWACAWAA